MDYGHGGFAVYIPPPSQLHPTNKMTSATASSLIEELENDTWIDKATRAVFVELNLFNPSSNVITATQFYCELFDNGYVTCSHRLRSYPLSDFHTSDVARYILEFISFGIIMYRLKRFSKLFMEAGSKIKFFLKWKTVLEASLIGCFVIQQFIRWNYNFIIENATAADLPSACLLPRSRFRRQQQFRAAEVPAPQPTRTGHAAR